MHSSREERRSSRPLELGKGLVALVPVPAPAPLPWQEMRGLRCCSAHPTPSAAPSSSSPVGQLPVSSAQNMSAHAEEQEVGYRSHRLGSRFLSGFLWFRSRLGDLLLLFLIAAAPTQESVNRISPLSQRQRCTELASGVMQQLRDNGMP